LAFQEIPAFKSTCIQIIHLAKKCFTVAGNKDGENTLFFDYKKNKIEYINIVYTYKYINKQNQIKILFIIKVLNEGCRPVHKQMTIYFWLLQIINICYEL